MPRIRSRIAAIALLVAVAACEGVGSGGLGPDVRRGLDAGRDAAIGWITEARRGGQLRDADVVALGYLERLRLGLGSPFRLIDYALADPRLDEPTRTDIAWALLARVIDRAAYDVDPTALDRAGLGTAEVVPSVGRHHLTLIENAVRESTDPRSGELAVRLAYTLAAAEGSLPARAPDLASKAAALLRDRELARDDALRLLRAAEETGEDPLRLLRRWRAERAFEVELAPMHVLPQDAELHAMELAPSLARALRELMLQSDAIRAARARPLSRTTGLLGPSAAQRLAALADSLNAPPQTPVTIAARTYRRELLDQPWLTDEQRAQRRRFIATAHDEERFTAQHTLLARRSPYDVAPALAVLTAATGLRGYAQEPVWFPGFGGPSTRELEERYGLAAIRFGDDVPADWRPYFRRMLDIALRDLYRVLPALDLRGLTIVFEDREEGATLAMHDPRGRRLLLPPGTTAGTIAHEVAHDLDWQVALRRYRVRGDYATDRATRRGQDRLAMRLQDLANGTLESQPSGLDRRAAHARRPAEVFARNIDWFVAVSLAAQGRINGYLSSVQDDFLTGYGTVRPPDITGAAGEALVNILDEVAPVYPSTRDWFLHSYGLNRALTAYDLARRVLEAPLDDERAPRGAAAGLELTASTRAALRFETIEGAREAGLSAIDDWICRSPGAAYHQGLESARRRLVVEAAQARARGVAITEAEKLAGRQGAVWMARELFGAQWPAAAVETALVDVLRTVAEGARAVGGPEVVGATRSIALVQPPARCAFAPLLGS